MSSHRVPLMVCLRSPKGHYRITKEISSLNYHTVAPGGYASAQIDLERPIDMKQDDIGYYSRLTVVDTRHGGIVWQGRVEDPSRGVGSDGRVWSISAIGPMADTTDRRVPLVYVFQDLDHWETTQASQEKARVNLHEYEDGDGLYSAWMLMGPAGTSWLTSESARVTSHRHNEAAQNLARVNFRMVGGSGSSQWLMEAYVWSGTSELIRSSTLTGTVQGLSPRRVGLNWTHPKSRLEFRLQLVSNQSGSDVRWAKFYNVRVRSTLFNRNGNEITDGNLYTSDTVLAHEIVIDLLGRLLPGYDGPNAVVTTTTTPIEQLSYPDGTTARDVLRDLSLFEPEMLWFAWEEQPNGKNRFEYIPWPTTPSYDVDTRDGYRATATAADLYNRVRVRWKNHLGRVMTTTRSTTVPELDGNGIIRSGFIDAGDNIVSTLNGAQIIGDQFLAEHRYPRNSGSLRIGRPILDRSTGAMVDPHEILPGRLIRVRGVQPQLDALNNPARDGVTVFRVVGVRYDSSEGVAELELDSKPLTVSNLLGHLSNVNYTELVKRRR